MEGEKIKIEKKKRFRQKEKIIFKKGHEKERMSNARNQKRTDRKNIEEEEEQRHEYKI